MEWGSDVCSSDLAPAWAFQTLENENGLECGRREAAGDELSGEARRQRLQAELVRRLATQGERGLGVGGAQQPPAAALAHAQAVQRGHLRSFGGKSRPHLRSEEPTSELQSLMR